MPTCCGRRAATFFCKRTTLVHFFSSNPSYFFLVASSKAAETLASSRKAASVLGALMTPRYAIMALCLSPSAWLYSLRSVWPECSQLFRLPVGQDRAHGSSSFANGARGHHAPKKGVVSPGTGMRGSCGE